MSKQEERTNLNDEQSQAKISGLKKLVTKVLTDKATRNATAMSAFVATVASVGTPWWLA